MNNGFNITVIKLNIERNATFSHIKAEYVQVSVQRSVLQLRMHERSTRSELTIESGIIPCVLKELFKECSNNK